MATTRRELLKLGGLGAIASIVPRLPAAAGEQDEAPPRKPLDERYLRHGLARLCSAHATDAFFTGHEGGAFVSAFFLARDESLEAGSAAVIQDALDKNYGLRADPFPDEAPAPDGVAELLVSLEDGLEELCRDGHNVIFLSLALRAMHELPQLATPGRIAGLQKTLRALEPRRGGDAGIAIPTEDGEFAAFVLTEFLGSTEGGPGQGFSGHLLTHGRAILDLKELGHDRFAEKCLPAYGLAVKTARPKVAAKGPREPRAEVEFVAPDRRAYWERRAAAGTMELGHLFKYPYGFLGLRRRCEDETLNCVCTSQSFRLFKS